MNDFFNATLSWLAGTPSRYKVHARDDGTVAFRLANDKPDDFDEPFNPTVSDVEDDDIGIQKAEEAISNLRQQLAKVS